MVIHFDKLDIEQFFLYGGKVIDESEGHYYSITEEEFNKIMKENIDYFKDSSQYECKIGKDYYRFDPNAEEFTNKTYVDTSKYDVPKNDPINIPNVCFSLIDEDDERAAEYRKQRIERGFDNSELWSLDATIAKFILPRLKVFRENHCGYPGQLTDDKWNEILDDMIVAFDIYLNDNDLINSEEIIRKFHKQGLFKGRSLEKCLELHTTFEKGMEYFHKYWMSLWD